MEIDELRSAVKDFFNTQLNLKQLPNWWRDPLIATADVDERFEILPKIAAKNHMLPSDLLESSRTVVVFFIPFSAELSDSNKEGKFPSESWGSSLSLTNELIQEISEFIQENFSDLGYRSELTPATYNYDAESLTARWSHKHLAHLVGLGRFGMNAQIITISGCAGRYGSLVTEAVLGNHPLIEEEPCLFKKGKECLKCLYNCPVNAITLNGIDRHKCDDRLQYNRQRFIKKYNMPDDIEVCAKCVSGMPCDLQLPIYSKS